MPRQFDPPKIAKVLALVLGGAAAGERASARATLERILHAQGIAGRDLLPRYYLDRLDDATRECVNNRLHPLWTCADDAQREQHRVFIEQRLTRWRLGWSDLTAQIQSTSDNAAAWHWLLDDTGTALVVTEQVSVSILDQISYLIGGHGQYIALDPDQLTVATLWTAHTHIFDRFMCSPRLAVCGPMQGLGKTAMMDVLSRLVRRPWRAAATTEASLYSDTDGTRITMLIDEMHYADLKGRRAAILHAGYRQGNDPARQEVHRCLLRRGVRIYR